MNRDEFLARVHTAAASGRAYRVATRPRQPGAGYSEIQGDLLDRLASEIDAVGGKARRVSDLAAARAALVELLGQYECRSALVWQHPLLDELGLAEILAQRGVVAMAHEYLAGLSPEAGRQAMLAADIGITSCDYAVAESGSLAMLSGPGHERVASLLPAVHIAIVRREQVLADLFDLFDRLGEAGSARMPSNLVLITGPSKTGDIELRLTTGVHGPHSWHVIVAG